MDTGVRFMFKNKKDGELAETFTLFKKSPDSFKSITDHMDPYIRERGDEIYNNKDIAKDPTSIYNITYYRIRT